MMDQTLRCNSLRCRQVLTTQAVVTNCSHIFCVDWYVLRWLLLKKVQTNCSQTREPVHCVNLLLVNQTFYLAPLPELSIGRLLDKLEPNRVVHLKNGIDGSDYKTVRSYSWKGLTSERFVWPFPSNNAWNIVPRNEFLVLPIKSGNVPLRCFLYWW